MKYLDEYRDSTLAEQLSQRIHKATKHNWTIMEVCGGQTHSILQYGLEDLLPETIELLHGPGCPVCVTPLELIDKAVAIASRQDVIFCSFGDMLRVPGSQNDLLGVKAQGFDVRIVYSPLDCLAIAKNNPDKQVVFFAVGFETTAPANAMSVRQAKTLGLGNFSILTSHVTVPPVITSILQSVDNRVQAFLGPGHVCSVMGWKQYEAISNHYKIPIVITGFEPTDLLEGILRCVLQLEAGEYKVENQYARAVEKEGNKVARTVVEEVFDVSDRMWRGLGSIPKSGYKLSYDYADFDAERIFQLETISAEEPAICISGQILRGLKKPHECPAFANMCTPETPLGATMVSSEGTCAAYYKYGRIGQTK
ncbi:MAG: hydrogenase formation protein HypD [Candidatus Obscuribacterales bacterium]|nr:hydrogenase formation protein HypD [Candidatus Obscuribacterales bacterium]